jgi:hypothetical protein
VEIYEDFNTFEIDGNIPISTHKQEINYTQHDDICIWGLDTCAGLHLAKNISLLTNIRSAKHPISVTVANGTSHSCELIGTVTLKPLNNTTNSPGLLRLENVYYAPNINRNLISGLLHSSGFSVKIENELAIITDNTGKNCGKFTYQNNLLLGSFKPE